MRAALLAGTFCAHGCSHGDRIAIPLGHGGFAVADNQRGIPVVEKWGLAKRDWPVLTSHKRLC